MRNLWVFLFRNRAFFWFLTFEFLAVVLIVRYNPYQGGLYLNSTNRIVAGIYVQKSQINSFLFLRNTNQALAKENAGLRQALQSSFYRNTPKVGAIRDSTYHQQYTFTVAKVINNTTTRRNNYLTLDQGQKAGIKPGDGVIGPSGIIGVVKDVSAHFCTVLSILHAESRVSVRLKHQKNIGSLFWNGQNSQELTVKDIPTYVDVKKGDTLETSGFSFFPEGLALARVVSFGSQNGENALTIQVKLLTDMNSLDQVYIVTNKFALEKNLLELTSEK